MYTHQRCRLTAWLATPGLAETSRLNDQRISKKIAFEICNGWFLWMSFIFRFLPFKKSNEKDSTQTITTSYQVVWRREVNIESVLLGLSIPIFGVSQWCHFHSVSCPKSLNSLSFRFDRLWSGAYSGKPKHSRAVIMFAWNLNLTLDYFSL